MKKLILILGLGIVTTFGQTNVYLTNTRTNSKTSVLCGSKPYNYVALGVWRNSSGSWFNPDTNIMSLSFSNQAALIQWVGRSGGGSCGHGTLMITDNNWTLPNHQFGVTVFLSNSIPWWSDTNTPIGIVTTGFTNAP